MDRLEPDLGISASHLHDEDDIIHLIDQWVRQFEDEADEPRATAQAAPSRAATRPGGEDRRSSNLDTMRSNWSRFARGARDSASRAASVSTPDETGPAPPPARTTGLLTTFTDRIGGVISLAQVNGRLLHRGTVSLRGSSVSIETACQEIGLPAQVTRAFEFVAAWFGYPFDSANVRPPEDHVLSWGFCGFAGEQLAHCLHEWNKQAPDAFASYCGAFGIGVAAEKGSPSTPDGSRPILNVRTGSRSVQGRGAEWVIASEPRLLAALARSGRDEAAQKTQVNMAVANWVTPIMFQHWRRDADAESLTVEALKTPRTIAPLLYLARRHGLHAATRLLHVVNERSRAARQDENDEAWIAALVESLRNLNREHDAGEVLRIWSSPELTTT